MDQSHVENISDLYLNQMIRALSRFDGIDDYVPIDVGRIKNPIKRAVAKAITFFISGSNIELARRIPFDAESRRLGRDWPIHADTMIGVKRLENIRDLVMTVVKDGVPGDLVETGVWRGGGSIMMCAALLAYGDRSRKVWCADSFEGLPSPDLSRYPQDIGMIWHTQKELAVSLEEVRLNFQKYGLLDGRVNFLKGWFKDTLPVAPVEKISILRLDGDLYASTMDALISLYHKISPGGFVIVDDYGIPEDTCRAAIEDFRSKYNITAPLEDVDGWAKYWRV